MLTGISLFHFSEIRALLETLTIFKELFFWFLDFHKALGNVLAPPNEIEAVWWLSPTWQTWAGPVATIVAAILAIRAARKTVRAMNEQVRQLDIQFKAEQRQAKLSRIVELAMLKEKSLRHQLSKPNHPTAALRREIIGWHVPPRPDGRTIWKPHTNWEQQCFEFTLLPSPGSQPTVVPFKSPLGTLRDILEKQPKKEIQKKYADHNDDFYGLRPGIEQFASDWLHLLNLVSDALKLENGTTDARVLLSGLLEPAEPLLVVGEISHDDLERARKIGSNAASKNNDP